MPSGGMVRSTPYALKLRHRMSIYESSTVVNK